MSLRQPGILAPLPPNARSVSFKLSAPADPRHVLEALAERPLGDDLVVGIGAPLALALQREIPGLRGFEARIGPGVSVPATQSALWCWVRGGDPGALMHAAREIEAGLEPAFEIDQIVDCFVYAGGRDLTGYEDGTENPAGDDACAAAILDGAGAGLDGSSFVAVQQWLHDLDAFEDLSPLQRDHTIGRRRTDNVEIEDAPASAHVQRTAQESFEPPAFLVRRSMPWIDAEGEGLLFIAFGRSLDAFDALLHRMTGAQDGVVDALFGFTRPITGSFYWCPPLRDGRLELRALGL